MNKELNPSQVAVITAVCVALGLAIPATLPRWDGKHMPAFHATKELFKQMDTVQ